MSFDCRPLNPTSVDCLATTTTLLYRLLLQLLFLLLFQIHDKSTGTAPLAPSHDVICFWQRESRTMMRTTILVQMIIVFNDTIRLLLVLLCHYWPLIFESIIILVRCINCNGIVIWQTCLILNVRTGFKSYPFCNTDGIIIMRSNDPMVSWMSNSNSSRQMLRDTTLNFSPPLTRRKGSLTAACLQ